MPALPRGTVTFLFTDIEGSTRLWQAYPATMPAAYARHDAILREAITSHGGVVYKVIGDALQVAFVTAPEAVSAALIAQQALQGEDWPRLGLPEPLRVRMALHTGAVEPDPDGDYRSPVLNRLGRLLGAGHGGQVLLSDVVKGLSQDHLLSGASLRDLGAHQLKDLLEPEHLHQLVHPDIARDFPPPVTLTSRPHNLPRQPTPFLGREREVAQLTDILRQPAVQLVTLTGPGGTGKTRLSLQAATELVEVFPDGVWFVELAALTDPGLVPNAIAGVLRVREEAGATLLEQLIDHLREKQQLLVLDNLEQLLPAAAFPIGELLAAAPGLTVLATSRGPLRLRAERELPVPPLGLPRRKPPPTADQLTQYEAVRLFIARAQAVRPDFTVTNENAPAVAEICHRLDGLPLAIELAAARIRMLPPEAMLSRLEQRLKVVTGGARDLPARQQTLRGAIAWSHELLTPDEQALFRRVSVFAGGATLEAIEAAAGDELGLDLFDGLERLIEQSLVHQVEEAGQPRFGMLETIREYGLEQLESSGEGREAHERHAAHFLDLAETAALALRGGPELGGWLERLETEHDNLRAALGWMLDQGDAESAQRLGAALSWFWSTRGHLSEGRAWLERVLTTVSADHSETRAKALYGAGVLERLQGSVVQAAAFLEKSLAIGRWLDKPDIVSAGLNALAEVMTLAGDEDRAVALYEEALALDRVRGDQRRVLITLGDLSFIAARQGHLEQATALLGESLGVSRARGDIQMTIYDLVNLGQLKLAQQAWDETVSLLQEALALVTRLGLKTGIIAEALTGLAAVAGATGHPDQAARLFGAADTLISSLGTYLDAVLPEVFERAIAETREALGEAAYAAHHAAGAALSLEEAIASAMGVAEAITGEAMSER